MSEVLLPLFPLPVVLFPGSSLPLHIFEERYKTLINESIGGYREFGITLASELGIAEVGCSAIVKTVLQRYDDGELDIIVKGKRRFRLHRHEQGRAPYLVGWVTYLSDPGSASEQSLSGETIDLYNTLVTVVYKGKVKTIDRGQQIAGLSFLLARKAGMDLSLRQRLLELDSEDVRLRVIQDYLRQVIPKLERLEEIERIVRSDGYR